MQLALSPRAPFRLHSSVRLLCALTRCPALLHSAEATIDKLYRELELARSNESKQDSAFALLEKTSKKYLAAGARLRRLSCFCATHAS